MEQSPLVSIVCTTYNQEKYIQQTIDGFISQIVNFPIEIIVHDDASTDSTAEIVRDYEINYPGLFHNIYRTENWYSQGKDIWGYLFTQVVRGKYIAICEGDDYWIDPYKLQKQVDFLEKNEDFGLIYALAKKYIQSKGTFSHVIGDEVKDVEELLVRNKIPTLTVLSRTYLLQEYISFRKDKRWKMEDYPLWLYVASKSKIKFDKVLVAVYRVLENSASHSTSLTQRENFIESVFEIKQFYVDYFGWKYNSFEQDYYYELFENAYQFKNLNKAIEYYRKIKNKTLKIKIKLFILYWSKFITSKDR